MNVPGLAPAVMESSEKIFSKKDHKFNMLQSTIYISL
jgi:hypothetical protein